MSIEANAENFQAEVIQNSNAVPVVAIFTASWCGPCKQTKPALESLAKQHGFRLVTVDAGENQELAAEHGVRGVPTIAIFLGGVETGRSVGGKNEAQLSAFLQQHNLLKGY